MASTTTLLLSASSPDGSLAAVVAPSASTSSRHLIQIYQVSDSSTTLQLTLTHTSHLPLHQVVFVGNKSVLGLLGRKEVVVWDLDRGVVATKLAAADDHSFLALASSAAEEDATGEFYYVLVKHGAKLLVQEFQPSNNRLVRKIKSGHLEGEDADDIDNGTGGGSTAALFVTESRVVVRTKEGGIRIMDKDSGKKAGKIKIKATSNAASQVSGSVKMSVCVGNPNILVAVQDTGAAVLYDMTTTKQLAYIPPFKGSVSSLGAANASLQLVVRQNGESPDTFTVLLEDSLYTVTTSDAPSSKNAPSSHSKLSQLACENPAAIFLRSNDRVLAIMYPRASECQVEWIDLYDDSKSSVLPAVFRLGVAPKHDLDAGHEATSSSKKRKQVATKVLGPGQAGSESLPTVKKMKKSEDDDEEDTNEKVAEHGGDDEDKDGGGDDGDENDDDEDADGAQEDADHSINDEDDDEMKNMSIAERLQQMRDMLEAEEDEDDAHNEYEDDDDEEDFDPSGKNAGKIAFKAKRATTESLKEILTQALQSSDDSLLELALTVRDVKIIATSLQELDDSLLVTLLGKLTSRLASTPLRAESLSVWLSHCLKYGSYQPEHLAALRNLLYERIESFSDLLRLEGRLSMMFTTE